MKTKKRSILIPVIIALGLAVLFSYALDGGDSDQFLVQTFLHIIIFSIFLFHTVIFPMLVKKRTAKKTPFAAVMSFGIFSLCFLYFVLLVFTRWNVFVFDNTVKTVLLVILFIELTAATIVHSALYFEVGFFFLKSIQQIISNILDYIENPEKKKKEPVKKEHSDTVKPFLSTIFNGIKTAYLKLKEKIKANNKMTIRIVMGLAAVCVIVLGVFIGMEIYRENFLARIEVISPTEYTDQRTVIEIQYKSDISFLDSNAPGDVLSIEPHINGVYSIRGRTLVFTPDTELPLSTRYKVKINSGLLAAANKVSVESRDFEFHTRLMEVLNVTYFYNVNELTEVPEELVAEITFSLPVDENTLDERIKVKIDGKEFKVSKPEVSEQMNIVYIKIRGFEQGSYDKKVEVEVQEGVRPKSGTLALETAYNSTNTLKAKQQLLVESMESYPVPGNTFVAIKFNLPVNANLVKEYINITPAISYKVSSEYRYAVLEAPFEPNMEYKIRIKEGLVPLHSYNLPLSEEYVDYVNIKDLEPGVRFANHGRVLPLTENLNVEFKTLNLDRVTLSVEKVYKNNLIPYLMFTGGGDYDQNDLYYNEYDTGSLNGLRKSMHSKELVITGGRLNEEVPNLINLKDIINSDYKGLYLLNLADSEEYYNYSSLFVHVTGMGLIIKNDSDNLFVYVVNLLSLAPMENISVSLVSSENQTIKTVQTDASGRAVFPYFYNTDEDLDPYCIVAEQGDDFTFLTLSRNTLDYSDFSVYGASFDAEAFDAFVTTERGVYRPGETVYSTILVRRQNLGNPAAVPVIARVLDPTGSEFIKQTVMLDTDGIFSLDIPTATHAKTGEYRIEIQTDEHNQIGSGSFKVEEFIPHTMEVDIELIKNEGRTFSFRVRGQELHGAPSRGLKVNCSVSYESLRFQSQAYKDYNFYDDRKEYFNTMQESLGQAVLDDNGEKIYEVTVPDSVSPPSSLTAWIYAEVLDTSGRPVADVLKFPVNIWQTYMGVNISGNPPYTVNQPFSINYIALNSDGKLMNEDNVTITIERKIWYSIFQKYSWRDRYESESYTEVLYKKTVPVNGRGNLSYTPKKGGEYTIIVSRKGGMSTTQSVWVSDPSAASVSTDLSDPGRLVMKLNKDRYIVGETAYLSITSPFKGRALVSFERDKVFETRFIDVDTGVTTVAIPVTGVFSPNMYVTAMAFRYPDYKAAALPPVSYGAVNVALDTSRIAQNVSITVPKKIRSTDGLIVDVAIPEGAGSKVVIAVVDEGILQVTSFKTPDPTEYFYRKRRLSVTTNTSLKDLLPDIAPYKKAFGGGGPDDEMTKHINPVEAKRVKSISYYSGVLECDADGRVKHQFDIDQFNGKLRVMVLSAKNERFGSAEKNITVSDPIVISPGIPRVAGPGDTLYMPVTLYNKTGNAGTFSLSLSLEGPLAAVGSLTHKIQMGREAQTKVYYEIKAKQEIGKAVISLRAEGNNEYSVSKTELAVRPSATIETETKEGTLSPGQEIKFTIRDDFLDLARSQKLVVSSDSLVRVLNSLDSLIGYPYGCTEQTVSKSFPMLYLKELAVQSGFFESSTHKIDQYIDIALKKLEKRLLPDGEFSYWDNGYGYPWVSDYASHFILEARRLGYSVNENMYQRILTRIGAKEDSTSRLDRRNINSGAQIPYRLYLKALAGKPDFDNMRSFYDSRNSDSLTEEDRCMIALAYALSGDSTKARELLPNNFVIKTLIRTHTGNFRSYVRNTALYLYALAETGHDPSKMEFLTKELFSQLSKESRFGNTQDTAWALMALSISGKKRTDAINVKVMLDGKEILTTDTKSILYTNQLRGKTITLKNNGTVSCYYSMRNAGIPKAPDPKKVNQGLDVEKKYFDVKGQPLDIKGVRQGDQIVVTLNVKYDKNDPLHNLVFVDLLPAGFEIENTRLGSRSDLESVPQNTVMIDYEDIRDDRIIVFVKDAAKDMRFSYVVRAVSPGTYTVPQFFAEAMYDPALFGRTAKMDDLVVLEQ